MSRMDLNEQEWTKTDSWKNETSRSDFVQSKFIEEKT